MSQQQRHADAEEEANYERDVLLATLPQEGWIFRDKDENVVIVTDGGGRIVMAVHDARASLGAVHGLPVTTDPQQGRRTSVVGLSEVVVACVVGGVAVYGYMKDCTFTAPLGGAA